MPVWEKNTRLSRPIQVKEAIRLILGTNTGIFNYHTDYSETLITKFTNCT
jgi:hypothetical protein